MDVVAGRLGEPVDGLPGKQFQVLVKYLFPAASTAPPCPAVSISLSRRGRLCLTRDMPSDGGCSIRDCASRFSDCLTRLYSERRGRAPGLVAPGCRLVTELAAPIGPGFQEMRMPARPPASRPARPWPAG
jgi:hypothetical protein